MTAFRDSLNATMHLWKKSIPDSAIEPSHTSQKKDNMAGEKSTAQIDGSAIIGPSIINRHQPI
jgi:hypothetical protein